jgi:hypothetical protein
MLVITRRRPFADTSAAIQRGPGELLIPQRKHQAMKFNYNIDISSVYLDVFKNHP